MPALKSASCWSGVGTAIPGDDCPGEMLVTFDVKCWTSTAGDAATHPVTLQPDWTIDIGHDLELERIAVGLGGAWPSCFALAKKGIPAIHAWRRICRRLVGVPLRLGGRGGNRFLVDKSVSRCSGCAVGGWDEAYKAMAHLRTLAHWTNVYEFPLEQAEHVWYNAVDAGQWWGDVDPALGDRRVVDQDDLEGLRLFTFGSSPPRPKGFTDLGYSRYEAQFLWDAGIHPAWASEMNNLLALTEPAWQNTLIQLAVRHVPPEWLAQFQGLSAAQVDWAVRHYVSFDGVNPTARAEWLKAGIGPKVVERLLGRPYTPDDVATVAGIMDTSWNLAGQYLADWLDADCQPTIEQIRRIFNSTRSLRVAPTALMNARQSQLMLIPKDAASRGRAFPTPRTWDYATRLVAYAEAVGAKTDVARLLVQGCVGDLVAHEFLTYAKSQDLPDPEDVLANGFDFASVRADRVYVVLQSILAAVQRDKTPERWTQAVTACSMAAVQAGIDPAVPVVRALLRPGMRPAGTPLPATLAVSGPVLALAGLIPKE